MLLGLSLMSFGSLNGILPSQTAQFVTFQLHTLYVELLISFVSTLGSFDGSADKPYTVQIYSKTSRKIFSFSAQYIRGGIKRVTFLMISAY